MPCRQSTELLVKWIHEMTGLSIPPERLDSDETDEMINELFAAEGRGDGVREE